MKGVMAMFAILWHAAREFLTGVFEGLVLRLFLEPVWESIVSALKGTVG
jgi:hypothetical protein